MINQLPTKTEIKHLVDELICPERADIEVKAFCEILQAVITPDNWEAYELAQAAQQYAFTKTNEFEKAFNKFVGIPTYNYEEKEKVSEVSETLN